MLTDVLRPPTIAISDNTVRDRIDIDIDIDVDIEEC